MADKFITRDPASGKLAELEAVTAGGTGAQAGRAVALGGDGRLDPSVLPSGIGADTVVVAAAEALSARDLVTLSSDGARKASAAATGGDVDGFVTAGVLAGAQATVFLEGSISGFTGLTPGQTYFLSEAAGGISATPVTGSGKKHQVVGKAVSATRLTFERDEPVTLA